MDKDDCPDLGMLCRFCEYDTYQLPEVEGLSASDRQVIETLCKICLENFKTSAVNG